MKTQRQNKRYMLECHAYDMICDFICDESMVDIAKVPAVKLISLAIQTPETMEQLLGANTNDFVTMIDDINDSKLIKNKEGKLDNRNTNVMYSPTEEISYANESIFRRIISYAADVFDEDLSQSLQKVFEQVLQKTRSFFFF